MLWKKMEVNVLKVDIVITKKKNIVEYCNMYSNSNGFDIVRKMLCWWIFKRERSQYI